MNIALGTDHGGFPLKSTLADLIARGGHRVVDCGASMADPNDDYPVFAERVARAVQQRGADRGILLCGSGVGASVAANKVKGIRAALCQDTFSAHQGVEDDDMNVLCIGARVVGPSLAEELVNAFLGAKFSGAERHRRRLEMVRTIEMNFDRTS
jgi:ribose 5-phosphate isomerase B